MALNSELQIFTVTPEPYKNPYTEKLINRFTEKILIDDERMNYQQFNSTFRNHKKLFYDGFLDYKYD